MRPAAWWAGNRFKANKSSIINKNPKNEHTKVIDFALFLPLSPTRGPIPV